MCLEYTERFVIIVISWSGPYSLCGEEKKDLICSCFTFLGTTRVTFALLLDLVALERVHLVGITVGLTLTSPVTDLKEQKHI